MPLALKQLVRNSLIQARERLKSPFQPSDAIPFVWWEGTNWGDALNPWLIARLSGKPVRGIDIGAQYPGLKDGTSTPPRYLVLGSTLAHADSHTIVWGAGFRYAGEKLRQSPHAVAAVRGPLSHRMLRDQGIDCAPAYGDPALLMPRLYRPGVEKRFELGIIPHYRDQRVAQSRFGGSGAAKVINVRSGTFSFIDQICSCAAIATSSLHGLIVADAYGIPAVWIEFSRSTHGRTIKFQDYAESVGRPPLEPLIVGNEQPIGGLAARCPPFEMRFDADRLLTACPFLGNPAAL